MTTPRLRDNPDYVRLLRRYAVLTELRGRGMATLNEQQELADVSAEMHEIELAWRRGIRDAVEDYTFAIGEAGNLGGTEL